MFIKQEELKSAIYEYQLSEIVEDDPQIVEMAIEAAVQEMISYLAPNRGSIVRYDTNAIFSAVGDARNALVLELCKSIAVWYICRLSTVDIISDKVKERYDRAISWLEKVSGTGKDGGSNTISPGLPVLPDTDNTGTLPYRNGSREKFNHE
jgi:phage gp36-like protein